MLSMLKNVADFVTPVLTESHFAEKGVLTPEEFVLAGEQLVYSCRTWSWNGGNKGTEKKYLPPGKQFLITRNVPSLRRAHTYALADAKEEVIRGAGSADMEDAEGWLSTHSKDDANQATEIHDIDQQLHNTHIQATASSTKPAASAAPAPAAAADDEIGDIDDMDDSHNNLVAPAAAPAKPAAEEFPDMEAFDEDDNVLPAPTQHEPKTAAAASHPSAASSSSSSSASSSSAPKKQTYLKAEEPEDNIVKTRTYDISIVYDKYYRTPRVYLFGYDEHRQPLTAEQIMEDISADHAHKTVTVETHPFLGIAQLSVHPCKHAHVMKRIVDQMSAFDGPNKHTVDVKQYMFIFLKFISSVIPTIEYDFTQSG